MIYDVLYHCEWYYFGFGTDDVRIGLTEDNIFQESASSDHVFEMYKHEQRTLSGSFEYDNYDVSDDIKIEVFQIE